MSFPLAPIIGDGGAGMMAGHKNAFDCIKAFSETDFTEDLKKIDVPTRMKYGQEKCGDIHRVDKSGLSLCGSNLRNMTLI